MLARLQRAIARLLAGLLVALALGLASCSSDPITPIVLLESKDSTPAANTLMGTLSEVSPPERIQQLKPFLDVYEPQVNIVSPKDNDILDDTTVSVKFQIRDFPLYKDADLDLGPHLQVFLDEQPYQTVYNPEAPIIFTDLAPGTHTVRALAVRPWDESFKNVGAYDQVTFNIFTESPQNNPDSSQALLTYSQPQGSYGAEPILLDFYLTNAPLHIVAESDDNIPDWRIRCTVNGESFIFDRWQPIYLKGFQAGKNWVKLEIIDENGILINNAFNPGIRVIDYVPGGDDSLSQLIRGEIPLSQARVLVDPNYVPPAVTTDTEADAIETAPSDNLQEQSLETLPTTSVPPLEETELLEPEVSVDNSGSSSVLPESEVTIEETDLEMAPAEPAEIPTEEPEGILNEAVSPPDKRIETEAIPIMETDADTASEFGIPEPPLDIQEPDSTLPNLNQEELPTDSFLEEDSGEPDSVKIDSNDGSDTDINDAEDSDTPEIEPTEAVKASEKTASEEEEDTSSEEGLKPNDASQAETLLPELDTENPQAETSLPEPSVNADTDASQPLSTPEDALEVI